MKEQKFFTQVEYREFRRRLNREAANVSHKGYETVVYDTVGDILGIMYAASIDERGRCHPTEYYLRRTDPVQTQVRLVA